MKYLFNRLSSSLFPMLLPSALLLSVGLMLTLPAFWSGNLLGADSLSHLVMSRQFINQLANGELYPRWLAGLNDGLGSPVMFFYGPVAYFITALFHPLVGSDPEGWHQLALAASLAVIASGFAAYAWLRSLASANAALITALLYMAEPNHLSVDLYQHFKFAELWGFVWMPLVLWRVHAVVNCRKGAALGLSVCYALLIMTHLPTTLLFSLIPPLYALFLAEREERVHACMVVTGAMLLGVGLSAVFLLPALLLLPDMQLSAIESGRFYFGSHFLFYGPRAFPGLDGVLKFLGVIYAGNTVVILGAYGMGKKLLPLSDKRIANFWAIIGVAAFFMMLPISKPVWELFPIIQKVQFPSRFGSILALSMVALLALWIGAAGKLTSRTNITLLAILGLIGLGQAVPIFKKYAEYSFWTRTPSLNWLLDQMPLEDSSIRILVEAAKFDSYTYFLPKEADSDLLAVSFGSSDGFQKLRTLALTPQVSAVQPGPGFIMLQLSHVTPRHLLLAVQSEIPVTIKVRQFYFPGWKAIIRGGDVLKVRPAHPSGLIEVDVPVGRHDIDLVLETGLVERSGQIISLVSFIIVFIMLVRLGLLAR